MPSPFPGMDPYVESNPLFHEFHVQFFAESQRLLQPQLRPKYQAKLERHFAESEESASSSISMMEGLDEDELKWSKQRRITIYARTQPRRAVASIELLNPSNKEAGSGSQAHYLEKRSSAFLGGLHWVEIDLLRGGERPPLPVELPQPTDYLTYVAQATPTGWKHLVYACRLRDRLPCLPIPLLGTDQAALDLRACFEAAYESIGADVELNYLVSPPPPSLTSEDQTWADALLRQHGLRP